MAHVIGLFSSEFDYNRSVDDLRAAGFNPVKVGLISCEQRVWNAVGCKPGRIVVTYAGSGALLGLLIYGVSALLASWCQCNLFHFAQVIQLGTFLGGILAGMFVGGAIGAFVGAGRLEEITAICSPGRLGDGKMIDVQVRSEQADQVRDVLRRDGACEVRIM